MGRLGASSGSASRHGGSGYCALLVASRSRRAPGSWGRGSQLFRMGLAGAVVAGVRRRQPGERDAARGNVYAWSVAPYGLVRTGQRASVRMGPAICIPGGLGRRPDGVPGAQGPAPVRGRASGPSVPPGSGSTTDRLITPFTRLRAQSGSRRVSPLNFTWGSGSIQRLLWLRGPSDLQE